jgi:hypothetical protein
MGYFKKRDFRVGIASILLRLSGFIYGRHPHNTIFSWNYLFTRKNIKWARKFSKEFKSRVVIDYGCGNLPYYPFFRPYADVYYALDFYFHGNTEEEKISPIVLNNDGSIPAVSVDELKKSDLILSFQVCSELETPEYYFSEIAKIAHPGTKILVTTVFGQTVLGNNDKLRMSPYLLAIILRNIGFKILVYEPGGFFFAGAAVSLNLLLTTKNEYDYSLSDIKQSKIKRFLFTPVVFMINVLALVFDFFIPLKRSPCQYLIIAEKL